MSGPRRDPGIPAPDPRAGERKLQDARDRFPDWQIIEPGAGYIAVPRGTQVVRSMTLYGLAARLRDLEDRAPR